MLITIMSNKVGKFENVKKLCRIYKKREKTGENGKSVKDCRKKCIKKCDFSCEIYAFCGII